MDFNDATQQYVKTLSDNFISSMMEKVENDISDIVKQKLTTVDIPSLVQEQISKTVIPFFTDELQKKLEDDAKERFSQIDVRGLLNDFVIRILVPRLEQQTKDLVLAEITQKLNEFNVVDFARQESAGTIREMLKNLSFPDNSIPGKAINSNSLHVSADNITSGLIKKFESTGIQDSATRCQVTILDKATVFENRLVASELEIAHDAVFKGNIAVHGTLPKDSAFVRQIADVVAEDFNTHYDLIEEYAMLVHQKIVDEGLDVSSIKNSDEPLVENSTLNGKITGSNLQTVGALKELQVIGETLLDQTLYVSGNRIGINTIEPERVLDLWDHEVQIVAGKREKDTAILGTIRNQNFVLTANNKDQITLKTDGTVTINTLNIGKTTHTSSNRRPTDNRPSGHIVWNENPMIGSPIGWVSLGGARWAPFGTISV